MNRVMKMGLVAAAMLASACGGNVLVSDSNGEFLEQGLQRPYAITARAVLSFQRPFTLWGGPVNWALESDDDQVGAVINEAPLRDADGNVEGLSATVSMVGEGTTTVRLIDLDSEMELWSGEVEVVTPDRMELVPAVDAIVFGRDEADPETADEIVVMKHKDASFMIRMLAGPRPVYGAGLITAVSPGDELFIRDRTSSLGRDRDWVTVVANTSEPVVVDVELPGVLSAPVVFRGVDEDAVQTLTLNIDDEAGKSEGDTTVAIVRARGEAGVPIYGALARFSFDGASLQEEGDQVHYKFNADNAVELQATLGEVEVVATVHGEQPTVGNTNRVSCVQGPISLWGLVALWGFARRRRGRAA